MSDRSSTGLDTDGCFIDGETHETEPTFEVCNPGTNDVVATVSEGGPDGIERALDSATAALPAWKAYDPSDRGRVLRDVADALRDRSEDLARLGTAETGRPLGESKAFVASAIEYLDYYAGITDKIQGESIPLGEGYFDYTRREPIGVVGQIVPWNAPALLSLRGIAPALACGNAVLAKPAPEAPLVVLETTRIASEAGLPDGVWNTVPGDGERTGTALTAADRIDKIVFTGSVETATDVMQRAARTLTPVALETGGKSPSIVFPDADLDRAITDTLTVFVMAGQVCFATTRLFVHNDVYDEFTERLVEATEGLEVGPNSEDPDIGPLITPEARDRVAAFVEDAISEEPGRVLVGGEIPRSDGNFYEPTVLADVPDDAPIACEEVFGPVVTVHAFEDEAEVLRRANDTRYGLYATVWTETLSRAHRVANGLEAGTVSVNEYPLNPPPAPFGGYKQSGIGREKGLQAIHEYTQLKNVAVSLDGLN
jgi:acyl-CoA reductase-like NAD-dependent aldehyde dehydrogenase